MKTLSLVRMAVVGLALVFLAGVGDSVAADDTRLSVPALIDELTGIDSEVPGLSGSGAWSDFIAGGTHPRMDAGLVGAPKPKATLAMRALVRRGVAALPALLDHLSDARPTKLTVHNPVAVPSFGGSYFTMEYDSRGDARPAWAECGADCPDDKNAVAGNSYTVRVGDVCFVLVGQIVNRNLAAVRYQPTALMFVNSPVHSPDLAAQVRHDWLGLTEVKHKESLIADLHDRKRHWLGDSALERLRFYYPDTYANLTGADALLRAKFEATGKPAR